MGRRIAIMCPTRNRGQALRDVHDAWKSTATGCSDLVPIIDDNDLTTYEPRIEGLEYIVAPAKNMNFAAAQLWDRYSHLMFIGDDHFFRTPNWDQLMLDKSEEMGDIAVLYADDLLMREKLATEVIITSNIVKAAGFFTIPELVHLHMDNYWMTLGRSLGCLKYVPEVVVEHMHFTVGKSVKDANYERVNCPNTLEGDKIHYMNWELTQKAQLMRKIRGALASNLVEEVFS